MSRLVDALTVGIASRQLIYDTNLRIGHPQNKPIRQSLGFREANRNGATHGKAKFVSGDVQELYSELDQLATRHLPIDDIDKLKRAWNAGTYREDIQKLLRRYGSKLWGLPMQERRLSYNSDSPLLVKGETDGYTVDLFWDLRAHREFIALQLEHLAFTKAKTYHENHCKPDSPFPARTSRKAIARKPQSLIVILRLAPDELFGIWDKYSCPTLTGRNRKHKANAHHIDNDTSYYRSRRRRVVLESDEEEDHSEHPKIQEPGLGAATAASMEKSQNGGTGAYPNDDNPGDLGQLAIAAIAAVRHHSENSSETISEPAIPRDNLPVMRLELRKLLLAEFTNRQFSHAQSGDATKMWEKSRELDKCLLIIWQTDKESLRTDMGVARHNDVANAVDAWLGWRTVVRPLGERIDLHPSQEKNFPRYPFQQWVEKLGGSDEYVDLYYRLTECQLKLQKSSAFGNVDELTDKLASAFAAAIKSPNAVQLFKPGIAKFNLTILSWSLDLES